MRMNDGSAPGLEPQKTQTDFIRELLRRFGKDEPIAKWIAQAQVERAPFGSRHLGFCEPICFCDELRAKLLDADDQNGDCGPRARVTVMLGESKHASLARDLHEEREVF